MLYVFIDNVAHTLASCLGSEGKSAFAHGFDFVHNLVGEAVNAQGRQRNADLFVLTPACQLFEQGNDLAVVARTKRGQRHLVIACVFAQRLALGVDCLGRFFTYRAVDKACLTKTAAADTSPENLLNCSVVDNLNERNDKIVGIVRLVHLGHQALVNYGRSAVFGRKALNCAVKVILDVVERRNVHALNLCAELQKLLLGLALLTALAEQIYYLKVNLLALTDEEQIDKIGNRLGVAGAGASCHYDIF